MEGERIEAAPSDMFSEKQKGGAGVVSDSDFLVVGEEETEEESGNADGFVPGPLISLKQELEKDKDDESLRRWKENLLGCTECNLNGQSQTEPEVTFHSLGVITENCLEVNTPLPLKENENHVLFALREGSPYRLKFSFSVQHNIVSGLAYSNTVWKKGFQAQFSNDVFFSVMEVDRSKGMVGTFAPQREPYTHVLEEETTPSGLLARGVYLAKLKFVDDDRRCHLKLDYSFEIKRH